MRCKACAFNRRPLDALVMMEFRFPLPASDRIIVVVSLAMIASLLVTGGTRIQQILTAADLTVGVMAANSPRFLVALVGTAVTLVAWGTWVVGTMVQAGQTRLVLTESNLQWTVPRLWSFLGRGEHVVAPWTPSMRVRVRRTTRRMRTGWWVTLPLGSRDVEFCLDLAVDQAGASNHTLGSSADVLAHPLIRALKETHGVEVVVR